MAGVGVSLTDDDGERSLRPGCFGVDLFCEELQLLSRLVNQFDAELDLEGSPSPVCRLDDGVDF